MKKLMVWVLLLVMVMFTSPAIAGEIDLNWAEVTTNCNETLIGDLAGYIVWWGVSPRPPMSSPVQMPTGETGGCDYSGYTVWQYDNFVAPVGTGATYTLTVPESEVETYYYVAVTAIDTYGNQSIYSPELFVAIPPTMVPPSNPASLTGVVR